MGRIQYAPPAGGSSNVTLPIAESDVTNLVADLALLQERGLVVGKAGTLPTTVTDGADNYLPLPYNMTLRRMKVTAKSVTSSMAVQLRKSTDSGANWSDVSGFTVTFASGDKIKVVDPSNVDLAEGDLLGLSITASGTGTDLLVEVVAVPR